MCKTIKLKTDKEKTDQFIKNCIEDFEDDDLLRDYDQDLKEELYKSKFVKLVRKYIYEGPIFEKRMISAFENLNDDLRVHAIHSLSAFGVARVLNILAKKSKKFDVNAKDSCDRTPLYAATSNSSFKGVMALLKLGADVHHLDCFGRSFVHMVSYAKLPFIKKLYKYTIDHPECGFKFDFDNPNEALVPIMIQEGTLATAKWLIEDLHCNVNAIDGEGNTALYYVGLFNNQPKKMLYLIEQGALSTGFSENAFKIVVDKLGKLSKKMDEKTCSIEEIRLFNVLKKFLESI